MQYIKTAAKLFCFGVLGTFWKQWRVFSKLYLETSSTAAYLVIHYTLEFKQQWKSLKVMCCKYICWIVQCRHPGPCLMVQTCNPITWRGSQGRRVMSRFEAILGYIVCSVPAWRTEWDPVTKRYSPVVITLLKVTSKCFLSRLSVNRMRLFLQRRKYDPSHIICNFLLWNTFFVTLLYFSWQGQLKHLVPSGLI